MSDRLDALFDYLDALVAIAGWTLLGLGATYLAIHFVNAL